MNQIAGMRARVLVFVKALSWCGVLLLAGLLTGCSLMRDTENTDLGSPTYGHGELRSIEQVSLGTAWRAALGSVQELGFAIELKQKDSRSARLEVTGTGHRTIMITLTKQSMMKTEVCIRAGLNGDETIARLILSKMQQRL